MSTALATAAAARRPAAATPELPSWPRGSGSAPDGGTAPRLDLSAVPDLVVQAAQAVAAVALLAVVAVLIRRLLRAWRDRRAARAAPPDRAPVRPLPLVGRHGDIAAVLVTATGAAATDLWGPAPTDSSDAVIRAWIRVEEAAAGSGLARSRSQTATEFTAELLRQGMADPAPVATLLRSYGQARFGSEPLTAAQVARAGEAFDAVHRGLAAGRAA
jgi:hypothetical protein